MDILIVATEAEGFIKTGGLGDFISGLAIALSQNNVGVKVVLPNYKNLNSNNFEKIASFDITNPDDFNPVNPVLIENFKDKIRCDVLHSKLYGADFYFIDNDYYFNRENIYGYDDDYLRFAFFSRAIKELNELKNWETQIVHMNDYHEGVLPLILNNTNSESLKNLKTLLSIHNLYFQGYFEFSSELDYDLFNYYLGFKWESKSSINFLKEAITYSDKIITVSPSYAENIKTKKFGNGLDELLCEKSVCGFVNGINMDLYPRNSDFESFLKEKSVIKHKIQNKFGLKEDLNTPLIIVIGRIGVQKGSPLILKILKDLILENQMILLGTGVPEIEEKFKKLNEEYSNFVGIIDFDESLAKELYMGGDIFLMPSCFEPCGISQLIAMHYANIPIVYNTGGLKDTIIYSKDYEKNNGFKFYDYDAKEFLKICKEALNIFNTNEWTKIMKNAYKTNYSWENQAKNYIKLYNTVIKER